MSFFYYLRSALFLGVAGLCFLFSYGCGYFKNGCQSDGCQNTTCDLCTEIEPWVEKICAAEIVHSIQHFLPYLRHEKRLRLEDAKVWYNDRINAIHMEFTSQDVIEIREARMLIVDLVEGLLAELNRNPIIAPDCLHYPLGPENLEIYIDFESFHGLYVDPFYVGWLKLEEGQTTFYAFDLKYRRTNLWNFRAEPYFKSRELVIFERESEGTFRQAVEMARPIKLRREQYTPPEKEFPRFFSPYQEEDIFNQY
jgi:hypothetical protein